MKLSIIIVSYNVKHYLLQCLRSVWQSVAHAGIEAEVIVVDNASSDGSVQYINDKFPADLYPHLHLFANSRNIGYGRANNIALRKSHGEYVLYLNPDTLITENTLKDCIAFADQHPELGAIGVKMLKTDGSFALESRRGMPTPWVSFCKMSGLNALFPHSRRFGKYYMRYLDKESTAPIEIVSGAFMMLPRKALERTGAFDEDFFMYGEDIDLSYRQLQAGFTNYYLPTPILHYKGESTQKSSARYVHVFYEAMLIFFEKHYRHYRTLFYLPIRTAIYIRACIALCSQQMRSFYRFTHASAKRKDPKYLYFGTAESIRSIEEIVSKWCLNVRYVDVTSLATTPDNLISTFAQDEEIVIFDTQHFTSGQILAQMQASQHRLQIGTYLPEDGIIICGHQTIFN